MTSRTEVHDVITDVAKVYLDVEDQQRALEFWTTKIGFTCTMDAEFGDERWIEVRPPQGELVIVLSRRTDPPRRAGSDRLPDANVIFNCRDIQRTHAELSARGVRFTVPPAEQHFGWWALFEDHEGTRFALGQWRDET